MAADVSSVIRSLLTGPTIDRNRADQIIAAAGEDGTVTADEKEAITSALTNSASQFTTGALDKLRQFIATPFSVPSTAGAFAMEKLLSRKDSVGIDVPTLRQAQAFVPKPEVRATITLRHFSFMSPAARMAALNTQFGTGAIDSATVYNIAEAVRAQLSEPLASDTVVAFLKPRLAKLDDGALAVYADVVLTAADKRGLDAAALTGLQGDLTTSRTSELARAVILRTVRDHRGFLRADAIDVLVRIAGDMQGHIGSYQRVLLGHLENAKLIDINGDGIIDDDDFAAITRSDGTVSTQKIGTALRNRVEIEAAIVDACYDMAAHPHDFEIIKKTRFSATYWDSKGNGLYKTKAGVRPSLAVRDICDHPKDYGFECATAMVIVYYKAMLSIMGDAQFDKVCANIQIGPWVYDDVLASVYDITGDGDTPGNPTLIAGTYGYIRNWDVSKIAREGGWQGENVIALGNGIYFGHPFGVETGENIIKYLNTQRIENAKRSASLTGSVGVVNSVLMSFRVATRSAVDTVDATVPDRR